MSVTTNDLKAARDMIAKPGDFQRGPDAYDALFEVCGDDEERFHCAYSLLRQAALAVMPSHVVTLNPVRYLERNYSHEYVLRMYNLAVEMAITEDMGATA